jgi:uncharacterized Zn ribbon protein
MVNNMKTDSDLYYGENNGPICNAVWYRVWNPMEKQSNDQVHWVVRDKVRSHISDISQIQIIHQIRGHIWDATMDVWL